MAGIGNGKRTLAPLASLPRAGGPRQGPAASAFFNRSGRDILALSMPVDDPLRTSMDPSGCVVRSIQPTLPGSGVISQSNWIPRRSSLCPHRLGLC